MRIQEREKDKGQDGQNENGMQIQEERDEDKEQDGHNENAAQVPVSLSTAGDVELINTD